VVVGVVGTADDPQGYDSQVERLGAAGAHVFSGLSQALEAAVLRLPLEDPGWPTPVPLESVAAPSALNVGLESFFESLKAQGAPAVQVEWRPPAGGDERLMGILAKMKGTRSMR
jgi:FdrA protein